jgi:signal transduction histidine kinase
MLDRVTAHSETGSPPPALPSTRRLVPEPPAFTAVRVRAAAALRAESVDIGARWEQQSRTVALRALPEPDSSIAPIVAATLVEALADHLASDEATAGDLVTLGLTLGIEAYESDRSLHHALKGLDLLAAMSLYAVETSLTGESDSSAADGVRVCRRLQGAFSLLSLAVTRGYTQAMGAVMRERFRHLRHDLRNPLGTIKSVLAIMDDETMPAEARAHPRFRAMAKRNARSLGELISDRLSDAAALGSPLMHQRASLRTIACSVRRDLRARAQARGATVAVGSESTHVTVDAVALELLLHEVLLAALQEASEGDEIDVEFEESRLDRAHVTLRCVPPRRAITVAARLEHLTSLSRRMGAELQATETAITLVVPVQREAAVRDPERAASMADVITGADAPPAAGATSGDRESGYDVRRPREREHGEPRPF